MAGIGKSISTSQPTLDGASHQSPGEVESKLQSSPGQLKGDTTADNISPSNGDSLTPLSLNSPSEFYSSEALTFRIDPYHDWAIDHIVALGDLDYDDRRADVISCLTDDLDLGEDSDLDDMDADEDSEYDVLPSDQAIAEEVLHWVEIDGASDKLIGEFANRLGSAARTWDSKLEVAEQYLAEIRRDPIFIEVQNSRLRFTMGAPNLSDDQLDQLRSGEHPDKVLPRTSNSEAEQVIRTAINKAALLLSPRFTLPERVDVVLFPCGLFQAQDSHVSRDHVIHMYDRPVGYVQTDYGHRYEFGAIERNSAIAIHEMAHVISELTLSSNPVVKLRFSDNKELLRIFETHAPPYLELFSDLASCVVLNDGRAMTDALAQDMQGVIRDYTARDEYRVTEDDAPHHVLVNAGRYIWQEFLTNASSDQKVERLRTILDVMGDEMIKSCFGKPLSAKQRNKNLVRAVKAAII